MCSLPIPEMRLTATSVPFRWFCNWPLMSLRNSSVPLRLSTMTKFAFFSGWKFSFPNSLQTRKMESHSCSAIILLTCPHVPFPVLRQATRSIKGGKNVFL